MPSFRQAGQNLIRRGELGVRRRQPLLQPSHRVLKIYRRSYNAVILYAGTCATLHEIDVRTDGRARVPWRPLLLVVLTPRVRRANRHHNERANEVNQWMSHGDRPFQSTAAMQ